VTGQQKVESDPPPSPPSLSNGLPGTTKKHLFAFLPRPFCFPCAPTPLSSVLFGWHWLKCHRNGTRGIIFYYIDSIYSIIFYDSIFYLYVTGIIVLPFLAPLVCCRALESLSNRLLSSDLLSSLQYYLIWGVYQLASVNPAPPPKYKQPVVYIWTLEFFRGVAYTWVLLIFGCHSENSQNVAYSCVVIFGCCL